MRAVSNGCPLFGTQMFTFCTKSPTNARTAPQALAARVVADPPPKSASGHLWPIERHSGGDRAIEGGKWRGHRAMNAGEKEVWEGLLCPHCLGPKILPLHRGKIDLRLYQCRECKEVWFVFLQKEDRL